nr:porin [uncultured Rhodoferax sp.]
MKKTLIALAVLAASGASFAQVTITGNYTAGYKASTTAAFGGTGTVSGTTQALVGGNNGNAAGDASGFGIDTSLVTFAAKEDLGAGMSVAVEMNIDGLNRGGISGGDSSLKLTTGVGRFTLQTYKPVDYLSGGISGVGGAGLENKVFPARSLKDAVGFDTKLGPVFVGIAHMEQGTPNTPFPTAALGLGAGATGAQAVVGQRLNSYSVTYIGGPLVANLNYLQYDNRTQNSDISYKDVIRTAGSYDFGSFKLGAGFSQLTTMSGATISDGIVAASVPLGSLTLGANFGTETANGTTLLGAGVLDQTRTGYSVAATYALSKRTSLIANYSNWQAFKGATERNSETNLLVSHSF